MTVWFEGGGCEPLCVHAYAVIPNYLEVGGKVEAFREGATYFLRKGLQHSSNNEMRFA